MNSGLNNGLWEGLQRSEKMFQTKMRRIYKKYDHAFEDDIVVNIIDFTCNSYDGPIPWDCETYTPKEGKSKKGHTSDKKGLISDKEKEKTFTQEFPIGHSTEILEESLNATCLLPKETSNGIFSRTFIMEEQCKSKDFGLAELETLEDTHTTAIISPTIKLSAGTKEKCFKDGHKQSLPYTGSNICNKTFFVSPLDTSISLQMPSFIRRPNKDCSFEDTRDIFHDYQADESRFQHLKETAYCNSGDSSLANYYSDMVECIRRLWEMPRKKRAADNIVQYYKRHAWNAYNKMPKNQMFYKPPNSNSMHLHNLRKYETKEDCSRYRHPLYQRKHFKNTSFRESTVHRYRGEETFTISSNNDRSINLDIFVTNPKKVNTAEVGSCLKEQNKQSPVMKRSPVRRNISSLFPLIQNPKAKSKMDFEVLNKTFTYQDQVETDTKFSPFYKANPLLEVTSVLSRSQEFPFSHSPIKNNVVLNTSMDSEASSLCKTFLYQNQDRSYNTCSTSTLNLNKLQTFMNNKPENCDVNFPFQENIKWFPKVAGSPSKLSPRKDSAMLKCRTDYKNTSLDKTFYSKELEKPFPGSMFSSFPVLQSPSKNTVPVSSDVERHSFYTKEPKRQAIQYITRQETHDVNSSFEDLKWFPKVAGTPTKMSPGNHSITLKYQMDPCITSLDNTFVCQNSVQVKEAKSFKSREQEKKPSHIQALIRRNSFSAFPLQHSPESKATPYYSLNNETINLDKTITYQENSKSVDISASCNRERSRHFFKLENSLIRRNSFSPPVAYNLACEKKMSDVMFEETVNGSHPHVEVQSSEMVLSLVNSPGSRRWKRQASKNLCFSTFKRQKSADETFIQSISNTTKPSTDKSSLLWHKTTTFFPKPSPETKLQDNADKKLARNFHMC